MTSRNAIVAISFDINFSLLFSEVTKMGLKLSVKIKLVIFPINEFGWDAQMGEFLGSDGDNKGSELE